MRYRFLLEFFLLAIFYIYLSFLTTTTSFAGFVNSCSPQDCPVPPNSCSSYENTLDDGKKYNVYECTQPPPAPIPQTCEDRCAAISDASQQAECFRQCQSTPLPTQSPPASGNSTCNSDDLIGTCPRRGPCQVPTACIGGNIGCIYENVPEGQLCYNSVDTLLTCTAGGNCAGPPPAANAPPIPTNTPAPRAPTAAPGVRPPGSSNPPPAGQPPAGGAEPPAQEAKCESSIEKSDQTGILTVNWNLDGEGCNVIIVDLTEGGEIQVSEQNQCQGSSKTIDANHLRNRELMLVRSSSVCAEDEGGKVTLPDPSSEPPPSSETPPGTGSGTDVGACRTTLKPSETRPTTNGQWPDSQWEWNAFCTNESACSSNADCTARNHKNPNGTGWCYGFGTSANDWRCIQLKQKNSTGTTPGAGQPPAATPTTPPGQPAATTAPVQPTPTFTPTPTPQLATAQLDASKMSGTCFGTTLRLDWAPVTGISKYAIRITDMTANPVWDGTPKAGDVVDDNITNSYYVKTNAIVGHNYRWWLHGIKSDGTFTDAAHSSSTITCQALTPTPTGQVGGPTATPTPTITEGPTATTIPLPAEVARADISRNGCISPQDYALEQQAVSRVLTGIAAGITIDQKNDPANINGDDVVNIEDSNYARNIAQSIERYITQYFCDIQQQNP